MAWPLRRQRIARGGEDLTAPRRGCEGSFLPHDYEMPGDITKKEFFVCAVRSRHPVAHTPFDTPT